MIVPQGTQPREEAFAYAGGLDQVTPDIKKSPGVAIEAYNFEIPSIGGYRRVLGYERYDGQAKPSEAGVITLQATTTFDGSLAVGDTLNGQSSGATGEVIYISTDRTWIALTKVVGSFSSGENLREGVTVVAVEADFDTEISGALANTLAEAAANVYRADINAVPGAGAVRGVVEYDGDIYAWRNNVGGTACVMHVSSPSGWVEVTLAEEVYFTNANTSVEVGDTLTQGGVTATIRKVIVQTGTLLSGTNTGKLVITGRSGGSLAGGAATSTGGGSLTLSGAQTAQSFPANGKYGFRVANFGGSTASKNLYGWNGVGRAFEFDGTYLAFIDTGMPTDAPTFGEVHINTLWLTFDASLQKSSPGDPHSWTAVLGAAEFSAGDTITGIRQMPGAETTGTLAVFTKDRTLVMYGKDGSTWNFVTTLPNVGARPYSVQSMTDLIFLDDLGLSTMAASDRFGNFGGSELSALMKPYVSERIEMTSCSVVIRPEGQYKIFYSDGSGVTATFKGGQLMGMMPFSTPEVFNVVCEADISGGQIFAGGTDGYVYELNKGRSFDGETINASLQLAFAHFGSPSLRKRMRRVRIDVIAPSYHTVAINHSAGRFDPEIDSGTGGVNKTLSGGGDGFDSTSVGWDVIGFDGTRYTTLSTYIDVTATDLSLIFVLQSSTELSFTMTGQITQITPRRLDRR